MKQLAIANKSISGGVVVVLAERDKEEMEMDIAKLKFSFMGTLVICRSGSPLILADLKKVKLKSFFLFSFFFRTYGIHTSAKSVILPAIFKLAHTIFSHEVDVRCKSGTLGPTIFFKSFLLISFHIHRF